MSEKTRWNIFGVGAIIAILGAISLFVFGSNPTTWTVFALGVETCFICSSGLPYSHVLGVMDEGNDPTGEKTKYLLLLIWITTAVVSIGVHLFYYIVWL